MNQVTNAWAKKDNKFSKHLSISSFFCYSFQAQIKYTGILFKNAFSDYLWWCGLFMLVYFNMFFLLYWEWSPQTLCQFAFDA